MMDFEYLWNLVDDDDDDGAKDITPRAMSSVSSDFSTSSGNLSSRASSPSTVSSSSSQFDVLSLYHEILKLEGWPIDSPEWQVANVAYKATARRYLIRLFLEKGCRSIGHGSRNSTVQQGIQELSWQDVIEQLANLGATIDDRNCRGDTALHLGLAYNTDDEPVFDSLLEAFLENARENVTNDDGLGLLHVACAKASADVVEELLRRFPEDIDRQVAVRKRVPFAGYTALHFAVAYGKHNNVQVLLSHKADIRARDSLWNTPLHLALYHGYVEMVDLMLKYDDKYEDCVNTFGLSHFMVACAGSKFSVAAKYLEVAALKRHIPASAMVKFSVTKETSQPFAGYGALHFAALHGNNETVRLLLQCGASNFAMTAEKHTPLALARMNEHHDVRRVLQRHAEGRDRHCPTMLPGARAMVGRQAYCAPWNIFNPFVTARVDVETFKW